mgnify:CR=1 FL=1
MPHCCLLCSLTPAPPLVHRRYDWGAPDIQEGPKKDLKYQLIVQAVQQFIERDGLDASKVGIWIDWQARGAPCPLPRARPPPTPCAAHPCPTPALGARPFTGALLLNFTVAVRLDSRERLQAGVEAREVGAEHHLCAGRQVQR